MRKKCNHMIFIFLFISLFTISDHIFADQKQYIFDEANILSEKEVSSLEKEAAKISEKHETDFVILTTDGEHDIDLEIYMSDFVDEQEIGYDPEEGNAVLLGIDLKQLDVMILGFEKGEEYIGKGERADQILDKITSHLSDDNFLKAFELFLTTADRYMKFRPGVNPENIFYKTIWQFVFAFVLGGIITYFMVRTSIPGKTVTESTYRNNELTRVIQKRDRYVRTNVTRHYRPRNKDKRGRGGRGRRSGRTKSGRSYSGSRRKF